MIYTKSFSIEPRQSLSFSTTEEEEKTAFEVTLHKIGFWASALWSVFNAFFFLTKFYLSIEQIYLNRLCQFMQHLSKNASTNEMNIELKRQNVVDTLPMAESLSQWSITLWPMFNWQPRSVPLVRGLAPAHYRYLNISAIFFFTVGHLTIRKSKL